MMNNRQIAIAKHNASKKRHANIFTGCLSAGTLKQIHKKIKPVKLLQKMKHSQEKYHM